MNMNISWTPKVIPGTLHSANKGACDWGWQRLFAYGCNNVVIVIDPKTVQCVQSVHLGVPPICVIKWAQEKYYHDIHSPYELKLAAGDIGGSVMIWNIRNGSLITDMVEANHIPLRMEWLKGYEVSNDLLLVLYTSNLLCLWNADTGVKLWKKTFQDNVVSFAVDPFCGGNMTVMSNDYIMLIKDLSIAHAPSEKGRKFYISTSSTSPTHSSSASLNSNSSTTALRPSSSKSTFEKVKSWADDLRGRVDDEQDNSCECLQVEYLPSHRNHVILLFPREILILDIDIGQALGSFSIENSSPSFYFVLPCRQRDVILFLHDNGSVSLRAIRSPPSVPYDGDDDPEQIISSKITLEIFYDIKCHSDVFRLSRASRLMGFCMDPVDENHCTILLADGRVLFWSLDLPPGEQSFTIDDYSHSFVLPNAQKPMEPISEVKADSLRKIIPPLLTFGDIKMKRNFTKPRFLLQGIFEGVSMNPVCVKMCPPMTTRNFHDYKPLVAIGCTNGVLQIFNASSSQLSRQFSLQCPNIKGIEWISLTTLLVFFYGSSREDKSEIAHLDINSGLCQVLPSSNGLKESTVALLRVSHLRQYFLVLFKNHNLELWDVVNLCQLREFPNNFPKITAFEWSPSSYGSSRFGKKKAKNVPSVDSSVHLEESATNILETKLSKEEPKKVKTKSKEHLVFTDADGLVYHYVVEGTSLRDGSKVPPEAGMNTVSYIAWKADVLVLGDIEGNLNIWDIKAKISRVFNTHRGGIKKIKFAPGKGNMKVLLLVNDGIEVWDVIEAKVLATMKTSKDQTYALDADWLSSSLPLLLASDGSIRILDASLTSARIPMFDKQFEDAIFNPRFLDGLSSIKLKNILQHQRWRENYDAEKFSDKRKDRDVQDLLDNIPSSFANLLHSCAMGTAERCIYVAELFGDESDWLFWYVALFYLLCERRNKDCKKHQGTHGSSCKTNKSTDVLSSSSSLDDFLIDSDDMADNDDVISPRNHVISDTKENNSANDHVKVETAICTCVQDSLDTNFDLLCGNNYYKKMQMYRIALHDSHRTNYEQTRSCAEKLILVGQMDRAVQMLLEGEPQEQSYYSDVLKACLISTVKSTCNSQSTIKLVATNLIASGKLKEGVELLCLVDKGSDACRYLQQYKYWELAAWLSKVRLPYSESCDIIMRWCDELCTSHVNRKGEAILILLTIGKWKKILELLFGLGYSERAVLFLEACFEFEAIDPNDTVNQTLYENIYLDYARLQFKLKNECAAQYYSLKAGGRGKKLLEELSNQEKES